MISQEYTIELGGLKELIARLERSTRADVIKKAMNLSGIMLAGWSKKNRLTGPRPKYLGVVTGRLRSSIASGKTIETKDGYETKIGTNVVYARAHEFGYEPRNLPARPFLRPSLADPGNRKQILNILTENINKALGEK